MKNTRLQQLQAQCWHTHINGVLVDGQLHFDALKYGEHIVRECAALCDWDLSQEMLLRFGVKP